jgi:hypothetical protein
MPIDPQTLAQLLQQSQAQPDQPGLDQMPPQQSPAPEDQPKSLQSMVQSGVADESTPSKKLFIGKPSEDNTPESFSDTTLRGMVQPQATQIPEFKDTTSPARSLLANMFLGMGASLTGTKFQSIQDQKYQRYVENIKLQQEQQLRNQQLAIAQMSNVRQAIKDRNNIATRNRIADMNNMSKGEDRDARVAQWEAANNIKLDQYNLEDSKFQDLVRHEKSQEGQAAYNATQPKNDNYRQAALETASQLGFTDTPDAGDPRYPEFLKQTAERKAQLDGQQASLKVQFQKPQTQLVFVPNPSGGYSVKQVAAGANVPPGALTASGMSSMNTPSQQSKSMAEMAQTVVEKVPDLINQVNDIKTEIGPDTGRWKKMWVNKLGMNDPKFAGLDQDLDLFASAVVRTHFGGRGSQQYRDALKKDFGEAQSPEDLIARINHADSWLEGYAKMDKNKGLQNPTAKDLPSISSQADYDALPKGAKYSWNGKIGTKK